MTSNGNLEKRSCQSPNSPATPVKFGIDLNASWPGRTVNWEPFKYGRSSSSLDTTARNCQCVLLYAPSASFSKGDQYTVGFVVLVKVLLQKDTSNLLVSSVGMFCKGAWRTWKGRHRGSSNHALTVSKAIIPSLMIRSKVRD